MLCLVKFKTLLTFLISSLFAGLILLFSDAARLGVLNGLKLCVSTIIPSLFLFTAVMLFVASSGVLRKMVRYIDPLSKFIFNLSGEQTAVMLMSFAAGYPVGARLTAELYDNGKVSKETATRMLDFCINAGPAFILLAVGEVTLGSRADGVRLLFAHILSSLLTAIISGQIIKIYDKKDSQKTNCNINIPDKSISDAFVDSVSAAAMTMLSVSAFVVLFSGIGEIIGSLALPVKIRIFLRSALEVTVGINFCTRATLTHAAFLLGFSGISVIFQVIATAKSFKPNPLRILLLRVWHGAFSAFIIFILEKLYPRNIETVLLGKPASGAMLYGSPVAAIALMFLGIVLICSTGKTKKLINSGKMTKNVIK